MEEVNEFKGVPAQPRACQHAILSVHKLLLRQQRITGCGVHYCHAHVAWSFSSL